MPTPNLFHDFQAIMPILPDDPESGTRATVANAAEILRGLNEDDPAPHRNLSL
jgi:hypothetical protein